MVLLAEAELLLGHGTRALHDRPLRVSLFQQEQDQEQEQQRTTATREQSHEKTPLIINRGVSQCTYM